MKISPKVVQTLRKLYHPQKPRLVLIRWEDASSASYWQTPDEIVDFAKNDQYQCRNVGWFIHLDARCAVVAARIDKDGSNWGCAQRVPLGMIREVLAL